MRMVAAHAYGTRLLRSQGVWQVMQQLILRLTITTDLRRTSG